MGTIAASELANLLDRGEIDLFDVRTPAEFESVHLRAARNAPLESLRPEDLLAQRQHAGPVYVLCKSGARGAKACEQLSRAGGEVVNVEGGIDAWMAAGFPVVRGKQRMSLERQVRVAAGLMVFVSSLLAIFVHPAFAGVAAFVGAGLTFAGLTDTCGMAMLLAKMPWNQAGASGCALRSAPSTAQATGGPS